LVVDKLRVSIVGGSGYTGGELLRLLLGHPHVEILQVTSARHAGQQVSLVHPNLRKRTELRFVPRETVERCDALFLCLPHGETAQQIDRLIDKAERVIDLSADFRLKNAADYPKWYGKPHPRPALLADFVYGIPELHREEIRNATRVAAAGCNATATILSLYPLFKARLVDPDRTVVEVKVGSSEGGNSVTPASHHPERAHCIRSYKPTAHRHQAEMIQELSLGERIQIHFSATAVDLVRGLQVTAHCFPRGPLDEKMVWKAYRQAFGNEPFIRFVKFREGNFRYPDPKVLWGTNYCDIGFEQDPDSGRLVVMGALDNLVKGGAGQAVQCFNLMHGFPETTALEFPGLHPV
jgi:N-acetyl-gamma-glutamyl-phosphate/LysW-gamma-L-alpha-aminoadipyl-6-phosphate reductase